MKPDLSISLICHNSRNLLHECLNSIYSSAKKIKFEIFINDNASADGTSQMIRKQFPNVKYKRNQSNLFFTKAHNNNLKQIRGRYFLVLNEDIIILPGSLDKIINFMDKHPEISLSSCRQIYSNGKLNSNSETYPRPVFEIFEASFIGRYFQKIFKLPGIKKMLDDFRYAGWKRDSIQKVDVIPGSFFLGRSELLKKVGLFDENLLLFYEEPDYCRRALNQGFHTWHIGTISIIHHKTKIIASLPPFERYRIGEHDMLVYYRKYFGRLWWITLWLFFRPNWIYWKLKSFKHLIFGNNTT